MFKLVYCLRRKPNMSVEEFQQYWRDVHAPLVAERAELLGIKRYIQAHSTMPDLIPVFQQRNGGSPEPYDGVAEIWFDSLDALGSEDPAVQQAAADLLADEGNFIDLAQSPSGSHRRTSSSPEAGRGACHRGRVRSYWSWVVERGRGRGANGEETAHVQSTIPPASCAGGCRQPVLDRGGLGCHTRHGVGGGQRVARRSRRHAGCGSKEPPRRVEQSPSTVSRWR